MVLVVDSQPTARIDPAWLNVNLVGEVTPTQLSGPATPITIGEAKQGHLNGAFASCNALTLVVGLVDAVVQLATMFVSGNSSKAPITLAMWSKVTLFQ